MRLIDAGALQKDIKKVLKIAQSCDLEAAVPFYRAFLECVEKAPTVDAAGVVHCKDCKFFHEYEDDDCYCEQLGVYGMPPDGFCSEGENVNAR